LGAIRPKTEIVDDRFREQVPALNELPPSHVSADALFERMIPGLFERELCDRSVPAVM
jgi:hypothetical protein